MQCLNLVVDSNLDYVQNKKFRVLSQLLGQKWSIFSAMFLKYDPTFFSH